MSVRDRLRDIVGGRQSAVPVVRVADAREALAGRETTPGRRLVEAAAALGGVLAEQPGGICLLVDRHYGLESRHGRETIGRVVDALLGGRDQWELLGRAWPSAAGLGGTLCVLDLETTGLAGGAGTHAFLIGCAVIEAGGVRVRQFLMPGLEHERAQLEALAAWMADPCGVDHGRAPASLSLVTFNGRAFDVPLVEMRYQYHRLRFPLADRPHLDMLHPARRLWRDPASGLGCALTSLERQLGGVHRLGDVPGCEIPSRYFQFVRDGDPRPLSAVLEHNRLDLLSTALLMARAVVLLERGPSNASSPRECLGLGRLYERAGAASEAEVCFHHAAELAARLGRDSEVRAESLRRLAIARRRAGRSGDAVEAWRAVLEVRGCPRALQREARAALAIHHEHRSRNLEEARLLVLASLAEEDDGRGRAQAEHRLRRLERKLGNRMAGRLLAW